MPRPGRLRNSNQRHGWVKIIFHNEKNRAPRKGCPDPIHWLPAHDSNPRPPPAEAAGESAPPVEPPPDQDPRQTGAGGFARSGAVEGEVPVPGKVVGETMEGGRAEPERAGDHPVVQVVVLVPSEIEHDRRGLPPTPLLL